MLVHRRAANPKTLRALARLGAQHDLATPASPYGAGLTTPRSTLTASASSVGSQPACWLAASQSRHSGRTFVCSSQSWQLPCQPGADSRPARQPTMFDQLTCPSRLLEPRQQPGRLQLQWRAFHRVLQRFDSRVASALGQSAGIHFGHPSATTSDIPAPRPPIQHQQTRSATAWQKGRAQANANRRGGRAAMPTPPLKQRVNEDINGPHVRLVFPDGTHKVVFLTLGACGRMLSALTADRVF